MSRRPIPRAGLAWLLAGQALVLLPLWFELPPWLLLLWLLCTGWRVQMYRSRLRPPSRGLRGLITVLAAVAVYVSGGGGFGLEIMAALLVAAFVLKLLELDGPRDAWVLILLGLFCQVVAFLFDASLPWALYSLLPLAALVAAMIGLQGGEGARQAPRLACSLLLQAVPLALLLFLCFPRMAPLWSLPLNDHQGRTGLDDNASPADIAQLAQSPELVFRASFEGAMPPRTLLYWRAFTLERFDGRRWLQGLSRTSQAQPWPEQGPVVSYRIIQEPNDRPWLFALDTGRTVLAAVSQRLDYRLQRNRPVDQTFGYDVKSWPQVVRDPSLSEPMRRQSLQLPAQGDPRSRAWAAELARQYPEPPALVAALLARFHDQDYHYTLRPDTLGQNSIDEFLFDTRRGFCGHYAGAMTFVLRAAGIPARMVVGYQGGELNPGGNYLSVRQYDAHAWVEYWQAGQGWQAVDPTFAVAPQRVEQGLAEALAQDEPFLQSNALRFRNLAWLNTLRLGWDNLNYGWERWVLGYQQAEQGALLWRWFRGWAPWVLPVGGGLILLGLALAVLQPWRQRPDPLLVSFARFERLLAPHGLLRLPGEGPRDYATRASAALPAARWAIQAFMNAWLAQRYAGQPATPQALAMALKTLRRELKHT
ncbi:Transglutaminase-like enzymes, putative cysteine proteases [Pseudomonas sp. URIL14HWK12:I9]|nr:MULTISPECIES: DUF3488 and DUF4129 domain-containing transglutaminase family protein [unclassified Pseudomonas]PVZ20150.1 uncharacterized protein DUF4129 [Pseudomonas sp. URIL14HWK12:I12]PVZ27216.1 uncharacterized protein DUF4129 [Pseudomonas sp. URIL14HWK12:I10]PVZ38105.1 uncharacterized protein DUF4129 [Pseudomonas sp. URIL14HWK12:I11]SNZ04544.1 Transglutaminase-like enzymes, putative cysteine proteases [Pseudomonas sp. URIL14HWK12:I9]